MLKTDYLTLTTAQILKKRFKETQEELKENKCIKLGDFREFALDREPAYNCPEGWEKIKKAWYGVTPDIRLTEIMTEYKTELLNLKP